MIEYRHYIAKNVVFPISLLIKAWWSSQNFSAFDVIIVYRCYCFGIKIEQSKNPWETGENYRPQSSEIFVQSWNFETG